MTPQEQKIMEQALEALETYHGYMEPLLTVFGGPRVPAEKSTTYKVEKAIIAIKEALAQQSNEQSKCNHTKTITRADIDGNQIETTCGECGERVAQQPQDVVRGLLSNEQVEPVARAWSEGYLQGVEDERTSEANIGIAGFGAKVEPARENPYTHPPVPTAQPKLQTCNCRWDGEVQVQQCTLHESHVDAVHEWAERSKTAEAKLKAQPKEPEQEPVAWSEFVGLACAKIKAADDAAADRDYMLDSDDCIKVLRGEWKAPLFNDQPTKPITSPQRTWVGLTDDERKTIAEANNALVDDDLFDEIEAKLKEKNT